MFSVSKCAQTWPENRSNWPKTIKMKLMNATQPVFFVWRQLVRKTKSDVRRNFSWITTERFRIKLTWWKKLDDFVVGRVLHPPVDEVDGFLRTCRQVGSQSDRVERVVQLGRELEPDLLLVVQNDQVFGPFGRWRERCFRLWRKKWS